MNALATRIVIVTGGGAGIGLGIVRECVAAGATVIALEKDAQKEQTVRDAGALFLPADVGDPDQLTGAIEQVHVEHGRLDGLVNNAGVTLHKPFHTVTLDEMDAQWAVNQRSVLVACQCAAPLMAQRGGGAIVNIASNHNVASAPDYEVYAGTKGAVVAMTRSMAWSLAPQGVRVNSLSPGLTMTEGIRDLVAENPDLLEGFNSGHATGTFNAMEDVGRVAVFLLSDAAKSIVGADLIADQGMSARLGAI